MRNGQVHLNLARTFSRRFLLLTQQTPIGSGFGLPRQPARSPRPRLERQNRHRTGGYSGIGLETTRVLRSAGAKGYRPGSAITTRLRPRWKESTVPRLAMDLIDPASIELRREVSCRAHAAHPGEQRGHRRRALDARTHGAMNYISRRTLGHFQTRHATLAGTTPGERRAGGGGFGVGAHRSPIVFEDPNFEHRDYSPWMALPVEDGQHSLRAGAGDERARAHGVRAFSCIRAASSARALEVSLAEVLRAAGVVDGTEADPRPAKGLKTVEQGAATTSGGNESQLDAMAVSIARTAISPARVRRARSKPVWLDSSLA